MWKGVLNLIRWASVGSISNLIVMMVIIYNNCVMYRTQHNDGWEGEVGKRKRGD